MVTAYVMIKSNTPEADAVRDAIAGVEGVVDVHIVAGDFDLIAKLSVESPAEVKDITAGTIAAVEGVEDTQTYIAME
jgi:DNA-binding Lrp family transcriptional regulator